MNETNDMSELEKQLCSWTPRRPSRRLERRLFASAHAPEEVLSPFRFSWVAPAAAALAVMCVLFNQRYAATLRGTPGSGPMVALILSNQSIAAYLPGSFQAEQNNLPADTFRHAGYSVATSGVAPLPVLYRGKQP